MRFCRMGDNNVPDANAPGPAGVLPDGNVPGQAGVTPEELGRFMRALMGSVGNLPQAVPREVPAAQGRATLMASFKKMSPPVFKGDPNPQVAEAWLMQINKLLDALGIHGDQDRIALVSIQLESEADHWWNMIKKSRWVE